LMPTASEKSSNDKPANMKVKLSHFAESNQKPRSDYR
jgi:hypothetical protein